ncbi:MAG: hypothetical protein ABI151_17090, partial [Chitinophagaceae bacterium]
MLRRFSVVALTIVSLVIATAASAQQVDTSKPMQTDPALLELSTQKTPKEYNIAGITITGSKYL